MKYTHYNTSRNFNNGDRATLSNDAGGFYRGVILDIAPHIVSIYDEEHRETYHAHYEEIVSIVLVESVFAQQMRPHIGEMAAL